MSDTPLTNEQLAGMEIFPGGATFGQAAETMGLSRQDIGLQPTETKPPPKQMTPAEVLAQANASRIAEVSAAADRAGGFVTGADQEEVDAILAGVKSGVYSAADALGRLSSIESAGRTALANAGSNNGGDDQTDPFLPKARSDAFSRMRALLSRFGLSSLENAVNNIITSGTVDLENADAIIFALRNEDAYKKRFAGNAARAAAGLPELDPATYIGLEESYRQLLQANGLPNDFYNDQTDFEKWIEGDVSPAELQDRINNGYRKVADADPAVRRQMQELYGVAEGDLAAFFLDPKRAQPMLTTRERVRKAQAAEIAARGQEQAGMQLSAAEAETLASRGITGQEAMDRFGEMGALSGLYQTMGGEEAMTREQQLGAAFRYDTNALDLLRRRQRGRVAQFEGGGQFARTSGATSGTIETGAGQAQ
jgi:hypothetical protein